MRDSNSDRFNLPSLLRLGDLDIRRVIRSNPQIRVEEYFNLLSDFLKKAPLAVDYLNKIHDNDAVPNDSWSLSSIEDMLEEIGCSKHTYDINNIIKADKRGHHKFASDQVKNITNKINELYAKIKAAEKSGNLTDDLKADDTGSENDETQTLTAFLKVLEQEEATRKMRILAIDDSPVMLKTISAVLSDKYRVYGMPNPTMLEKFLQQITPELFLLDYKMPELSGFDLVPIIRSFEEHKDTPIIFLTSMGTVNHVSAAFALGACDFIVKPFQGNTLCEKIAKHIVRKKLF